MSRNYSRKFTRKTARQLRAISTPSHSRCRSRRVARGFCINRLAPASTDRQGESVCRPGGWDGSLRASLPTQAVEEGEQSSLPQKRIDRDSPSIDLKVRAERVASAQDETRPPDSELSRDISPRIIPHLRARATISTTGSVARRDGVIPLAVKGVGRDPQSREHLVGDLEGGLVAARVERGLHA
jgi:hypothetical protein